ncbi:hypothetical protein GCM10018780_88400 [Streptomyces lanatus]|nr:hypothetical protein GCM10018780_88400 [Streptomyces lanatus]
MAMPAPFRPMAGSGPVPAMSPTDSSTATAVPTSPARMTSLPWPRATKTETAEAPTDVDSTAMANR